MANNKVPVKSTGPALGNVPTQDSYLRIKQNIEGLQTALADVSHLATSGQPLTADQLKQVQNALQAGGLNLLNVTGLPGLLLQLQNAKLPEVNALPGTAPDGQAVLYHHTVWRFSGNRHAWEEVSIIAIQDTRVNMANYNANAYGPGVFFNITDWRVLYINQSNKWTYAAGDYAAALASIPANLNVSDTGFQFQATDYNHSYRWNGNNWNFAPGDPGSEYIVASNNGNGPRGGPWALCNGGAANVATDSGTITSVTTANMSGGAFIVGGSPTAPQAGSAPTWAAGAHTDSNNFSSNGTTDNTSLTIGNNGDHFHVINQDVNIQNLQTGNNLFAFEETFNPTQNNGIHTHDLTPNPHNHTFTVGNTTASFNLSNANAVLNIPSDANGGLPFRVTVGWWMRR